MLIAPLAYSLTLTGLEEVFQRRYDRELGKMYTGDTRHLFDGSLRLQDVLRKNIDAFLASRHLIRWGVSVTVAVKTREGLYLYPAGYDENMTGEMLSRSDTLAIARENFDLLDQGLIRTIEVKIDHLSPLSILVLMAYMMISAFALYFFFYRKGLNRFNEAEKARKMAMDHLEQSRKNDLDRLARLETQRGQLSERIDTIRRKLEDERRKASDTENAMMDELLSLEQKVAEYQTLHDEQLNEIHQLRETLQQFEKEKDEKKQKPAKGGEGVKKRFSTLYKNIEVHERAVAGFMELTEEMKIKAEEVISHLNEDPKTVQIKRKVFGKKNRETVFEVIFSYRGRLYFRNIANNQIEVLTIGSKLTQNKDLAFLDKL
ncbi:hypothetical protein LJC22_04850 [Desulfosarcina sp. OttesenSCG-928-G10]|nr:hypothetical protein [Desulfosarcina sp. OttesenSCG-928-G10]MDL2321325.1 hypothetical protein [Desulfosarcina sp. OttesenSCG-928-B08]